LKGAYVTFGGHKGSDDI